MNLISWNCRGLGNPATVQEAREFAAKFTPVVLCLIETQISSDRAEALAGSLGFDHSYAIGSLGRSGGIAVYWNDVVEIEVLDFSRYHIDTQVKGLAQDLIRVTFVYGEAQVSERYKTWDTLKSIAGNSGLPWLALGDFNEVLHQTKHDGVNRRSQDQMDGFRDALDVCGLVDLGFKGRRWTFEKRVAGGTFTWVRLDRAVADPVWCAMFAACEVSNVAAASSDHGPVLLKLDVSGAYTSPKVFCYEQKWERHPDLCDFMQAT